jgi:uncharacterized protein YndB with AHSA1/START domain
MPAHENVRRTDVRIERHFHASPERVFEAWTDPEQTARWMWASLGKDAWAESDLRAGGAYRIYTHFDGGRHQGVGWSGMCGLYVEIVPNQKLVYTVHWDADVGYNQSDDLVLDEVVSVTFSPDGEGTRVTLVHIGIPDDGHSAPTHKLGIEQSLDMLADHLESGAAMD